MASYKRLGGMAALLMLLVFPASASMVSFQLVETGTSGRGSSSEFSNLWESGLMAAFFDAGHIVTSSPIMQAGNASGPDLNGKIEESLTEAAEGGAAYFIVGFIEYNAQRGRLLPVGILLKVYDSNSRQRIYEQSFPAGTGRNNREEFQLAQNAGRLIISQMRGR